MLVIVHDGDSDRETVGVTDAASDADSDCVGASEDVDVSEPLDEVEVTPANSHSKKVLQ